jgi:pimeloyl-ACP methyl ester carboxylesterase
MQINGVEVHIERNGDPADPTILLLAGMASPLDWWDDRFCDALAAGGRHVVRFDYRDTGESVSYPAGKPSYTGADLASDAVGILDTLGIPSAHLAGISMGGALAQRIALSHPDRVASLVLMSTTLLDRGDASLPPPTPDMLAYFTNPPPEPDWSDQDAAVRHLVDMQRVYMSPEDFDPEAVARTAHRIVARTHDLAASAANHALIEDGPAPAPSAPLRVPTLVIHGTSDQLFPFPHGEALAKAVPGAKLLPLPGVGHQTPPPRTWPTVVPAILQITSIHGPGSIG